MPQLVLPIAYSNSQVLAGLVGLVSLVAWQLYTTLWVYVPRHLFAPRRTLTLSKPKQLVLPREVMDIIIGYYLEFVILRSRNYRIGREEYLSDIGRLKLCSRDFRMRVDNQMSRIWPHWASRGPCSAALNHDSAITMQYGPDTRIITADVCSCCLPQGANLAIYPKLERVSLNCHNALRYDPLGNTFSILPLHQVVALPRFLTQLEVVRSHRPVDQIIELFSSACPNLVELRIVRCTMFNQPNCWWWRQHWHDTDHEYMRSHDWRNMEGYAEALAGCLYGLKNLQAFHIGHYMTNINAVMTHRTQHKNHHPKGFRDSLSPVDWLELHNDLHLQALQLRDGGPSINPNSIALAKRELWEVPCPQCEQQLRAPIEDTERWVASILASKLESIRTISFPSFLSEKRIDPSLWNVQREIKLAPGEEWGIVDKLWAAYRYPVGAKLRVKAKGAESRRFSGSYEVLFDNTRGEWRPVPR